MTLRESAFVTVGLALVAFFSMSLESEILRRGVAENFGGVVQRVLGSAREGAGDLFLLKADSYLHRGTAHTDEGVEDGEALEDSAEAPPQDWIESVNRRVKSNEHVHLTPVDQQEIIPLLAMGISLNPHNVDAVITTAFWLREYLGKKEEAVKVLTDGLQANPQSWQIAYELARLYLKEKRYREAEKYFDAALQNSLNADLVSYERVNLRTYFGECLSAMEDAEGALFQYRQAFKLMDNKTSGLGREIVVKIRRIESVLRRQRAERADPN